jgi:hypothetical protein
VDKNQELESNLWTGGTRSGITNSGKISRH